MSVILFFFFLLQNWLNEYPSRMQSWRKQSRPVRDVVGPRYSVYWMKKKEKGIFLANLWPIQCWEKDFGGFLTAEVGPKARKSRKVFRSVGISEPIEVNEIISVISFNSFLPQRSYHSLCVNSWRLDGCPSEPWQCPPEAALSPGSCFRTRFGNGPKGDPGTRPSSQESNPSTWSRLAESVLNASGLQGMECCECAQAPLMLMSLLKALLTHVKGCLTNRKNTRKYNLHILYDWK